MMQSLNVRADQLIDNTSANANNQAASVVLSQPSITNNNNNNNNNIYHQNHETVLKTESSTAKTFHPYLRPSTTATPSAVPPLLQQINSTANVLSTIAATMPTTTTAILNLPTTTTTESMTNSSILNVGQQFDVNSENVAERQLVLESTAEVMR